MLATDRWTLFSKTVSVRVGHAETNWLEGRRVDFLSPAYLTGAGGLMRWFLRTPQAADSERRPVFKLTR